MKTIMKLFSIMTLSALLVLHNAVAKPKDAQTAFAQNYAKGLMQGNPLLFTGAFSDKVKIMPEYDLSFLGGDMAQQYYTAILNKYDIKSYKRSTIEQIDLGDQLLDIGSFEIHFSLKTDKEPVTLKGAYFEIWDTASADEHKLLTQAWNYDHHVEGIEQIFRSNAPGGVHYIFQPTIVLDTPINQEIAASQMLGVELMHRNQPELLALKYAEDAWYTPHNRPIQKGREAIKAFQLDYAKNWPTFDYIDVNTHDVHVHGPYVLGHMTYNLRWRTAEYSGVVMGKGIRLTKRGRHGVMETYRSIAMHD